jgi:hypothetical protein
MSRKGTPLYMAPEVYEGKEYNGSVDTYSLSIVMYRYLNHERVPFLPDYPTDITPTIKDQALNMRLSNCPLPPLKGVSPALGNIVLKAASFDSNARFQNATEMRLAIEAFQAGIRTAPIPAVPDQRPKFDPPLSSTDYEKTIKPIIPKPAPIPPVSVDIKTPISKPKSNLPKARNVMNIREYELLKIFLILILLYSTILLKLTSGFAVILFILFIILVPLLKSIIIKLKLDENLSKIYDNLSDKVAMSRFFAKIKLSSFLKVFIMLTIVISGPLIWYPAFDTLLDGAFFLSIVLLYYVHIIDIVLTFTDYNSNDVFNSEIGYMFILTTMTSIPASVIVNLAPVLYYPFSILYTNCFLLGWFSDLKLKLKITLLIVFLIILILCELFFKSFVNEDINILNSTLFVIIPSISTMISGYLLHKSKPE